MAKRKLTIIDGRLVLHLEAADEGGYIVSSPNDPALNTQGETIEECIANGRDAAKTIAAGQRKLAKLARQQRGQAPQPVAA